MAPVSGVDRGRETIDLARVIGYVREIFHKLRLPLD
jgi:hypothetical protein